MKNFVPRAAFPWLVLMLLCSMSHVLIAQQYMDLAKLSFTTTPRTSYENGGQGSALNELNLQIDLPLVLDESYTILAGLSAHRLRAGLDPDPAPETHVYALGLTLGLHRKFSDTWAATALALPKLATTFDEGLATGYQWGLLLLLTHTKSERANITYGLYTNTEAYGLLLVPLLGGYYSSPDGRWEARVLLPISVDVNYTLGSRTAVGLTFDGLGTSYMLNTPEYPNSYVNSASNQLFAYTQWKMTPSLLLRAQLGYDFFRAYKVYDRGDTVDFSIASIYFGDQRTIRNSLVEDGLLFKVGLRYRFHFGE